MAKSQFVLKLHSWKHEYRAPILDAVIPSHHAEDRSERFLATHKAGISITHVIDVT